MMAVIVSVLLSFSYLTESESEEEGQLEDLWSKLSAHSNTAPGDARNRLVSTPTTCAASNLELYRPISELVGLRLLEQKDP